MEGSINVPFISAFSKDVQETVLLVLLASPRPAALATSQWHVYPFFQGPRPKSWSHLCIFLSLTSAHSTGSTFKPDLSFYHFSPSSPLLPCPCLVLSVSWALSCSFSYSSTPPQCLPTTPQPQCLPIPPTPPPLCFFCCHAHRVIFTIFLNSIYMH